MGGQQRPIHPARPAMNADCVVVDANLAFKALAACRGDLRDRMGKPTAVTFYAPRFLVVELFILKRQLQNSRRWQRNGGKRMDFLQNNSFATIPLPQSFRLLKSPLNSAVELNRRTRRKQRMNNLNRVTVAPQARLLGEGCSHQNIAPSLSPSACSARSCSVQVLFLGSNTRSGSPRRRR